MDKRFRRSLGFTLVLCVISLTGNVVQWAWQMSTPTVSREGHVLADVKGETVQLDLMKISDPSRVIVNDSTYGDTQHMFACGEVNRHYTVETDKDDVITNVRMAPGNFPGELH